LPRATLREDYALEYGTDAVEIHRDGVQEGQRVLLVDDLLATGGTAAAAGRLLRRAGGEVVGMTFLIELAFLEGRGRLADFEIHSQIRY
jgi:adenine phosphoribosyltransferase